MTVRDVPCDEDRTWCSGDASRATRSRTTISVPHLVAHSGATTFTLVDSAGGRTLPGHSRVMWTTRDQTASSNLLTSFRDAYPVATQHTYASEVDSGFSIDNLNAGDALCSRRAMYAAGVASLTWGERRIRSRRLPRVARQRVARSSAWRACRGTSFVDETGVRCAYTGGGGRTTTSRARPSSRHDAAAADGVLPTAVALSRPEPNPSAVTTACGCRRRANVRARVLDAQGRVVRTPREGAFAAGMHRALAWDGLDGGGRETPGDNTRERGDRRSDAVRRLVRVRW